MFLQRSNFGSCNLYKPSFSQLSPLSLVLDFPHARWWWRESAKIFITLLDGKRPFPSVGGGECDTEGTPSRQPPESHHLPSQPVHPQGNCQAITGHVTGCSQEAPACSPTHRYWVQTTLKPFGLMELFLGRGSARRARASIWPYLHDRLCSRRGILLPPSKPKQADHVLNISRSSEKEQHPLQRGSNPPRVFVISSYQALNIGASLHFIPLCLFVQELCRAHGHHPTVSHLGYRGVWGGDEVMAPTSAPHSPTEPLQQWVLFSPSSSAERKHF